MRHCLFVCFAVTLAVFLRSDGDAFVNNFQAPPTSTKSELNFSWKMNPGSFQDGIENTSLDFQTAAASTYEDPNASSASVLNEDELAGVVTGSAVGAGLIAGGAGAVAGFKGHKRGKKGASVGGGSKIGNFFRTSWAKAKSLVTKNSSPSTLPGYSMVRVEDADAASETPRTQRRRDPRIVVHRADGIEALAGEREQELGASGTLRPHDPYRDIDEADKKKRGSSGFDVTPSGALHGLPPPPGYPVEAVPKYNPYQVAPEIERGTGPGGYDLPTRARSTAVYVSDLKPGASPSREGSLRTQVPPLPLVEMGLSSRKEGASADSSRHSVRSVSSVSVKTSSQRNARGTSMLPPPPPGSAVSRKDKKPGSPHPSAR